MKKYLKIWRQLAKNSFMSYAANRLDFGAYFIGKVVRFVFFWIFIVSLFNFIPSFAGYTRVEALLIFITYNLVDTLSQFFFRGLYVFKSDIRHGRFDYILSKPVRPLFYVFSRLPDVLDLISLVPLAILFWHILGQWPEAVTAGSLLAYFTFLALGLLIIFSFHVFVGAVIVRTGEGDAAIFLYRDVLGLARFPAEIFPSFWRIVLTTVVPVLVAVTFPVRALLGRLGTAEIFLSLIVAMLFTSTALLFWRASVRYYASASS